MRLNKLDNNFNKVKSGIPDDQGQNNVTTVQIF